MRGLRRPQTTVDVGENLNRRSHTIGFDANGWKRAEAVLRQVNVLLRSLNIWQQNFNFGSNAIPRVDRNCAAVRGNDRAANRQA